MTRTNNLQTSGLMMACTGRN